MTQATLSIARVIPDGDRMDLLPKAFGRRLAKSGSNRLYVLRRSTQAPTGTTTKSSTVLHGAGRLQNASHRMADKLVQALHVG